MTVHWERIQGGMDCTVREDTRRDRHYSVGKDTRRDDRAVREEKA